MSGHRDLPIVYILAGQVTDLDPVKLNLSIVALLHRFHFCQLFHVGVINLLNSSWLLRLFLSLLRGEDI